MASKLSDEEIGVLQSLDAGQASGGAAPGGAELPKRLFEFNLVARQPDGKLMLTKAGQRALFQHQCIGALDAMARGEMPVRASGVERWLAASGFVTSAGPDQEPRITPRGRLWMNSFEPDDPGRSSSGH